MVGMKGWTLSRATAKTTRAMREKGLVATLRLIWENAERVAALWIRRRLMTPGYFSFQGARYEYFWHAYNETWRNERAVEVALILPILEDARGKKILEVGNVLSHYHEVQHTVVDKYERDEGILNLDIIDFETDEKFDLIISVSTLEHVGWDEEAKEPDKIPRVLKHLKGMLARDGTLVATMPLGHNPYLDAMLMKDALTFDDLHFMARVSNMKWREASLSEVRNSRYDYPYRAANALAVGFIRQNGGASPG